MNGQEIKPDVLPKLLESLSDEMELRNVPETELVIIGGAAMNLGDYHRRATIDVDVLGVLDRSQPSGDVQLLAKFPKSLQGCVQRTAAEYSLMEKWLNFGPASLRGSLPENFLRRANKQSFGDRLSVHIAARIDLIYLKTHAVINTKGSDHGIVHREDLEKLNPDASELMEAINWSHGIYRTIDEQGTWDNKYLRKGYRLLFNELVESELPNDFFRETD